MPSSTGSKVLLAYFSRAGENYGGRTDLTVGNTDVLAGMISRLIGYDVHRIEAADPYLEEYAATVERNVREQRGGARPAIANRLALVERTSACWAADLERQGADESCRHSSRASTSPARPCCRSRRTRMSGLGTTARDYAASCPGATIGVGLAVRGEEVGDAGAAVEAWLRHTTTCSRPDPSIRLCACPENGKVRWGVKTTPQHTTYEAMLKVWQEADRNTAFEHGWLFDHFNPIQGSLDGPCFEGWTTLAALASRTERIRLGLMVAGNTYRHPAVHAHMAATVDVISNGRLDFGVGAGWNEYEHSSMGIPLYAPGERIRRRRRGVRDHEAALHPAAHRLRRAVLPA